MNVSLEQAQKSFSIYKTQYGNKVHQNHQTEGFNFNTNESIEDNLNQLAYFALKDPLLARLCYSNVFLDLVGRWIENPGHFDSIYKQEFNVDYCISGTVIIHGLSKLVNISNESISLIEYYLLHYNEQLIQQLNSIFVTNQTIDPQELELILLSYYRFINFNHHKFKKFISPSLLNKILSLESNTYAVCRYLSILILCNYLQASEQIFHDYLCHYNLKQVPLVSYLDGDQIDFRFLDVVELKRIANFHNMVNANNLNHTTSKNQIIVIGSTPSEMEIGSYWMKSIWLLLILTPRI